MTTMLRLKNVKIGSEFAEADFYPEDGMECGHVVVNLLDGDIVSCVEVAGFGPSYSAHARQRLIKMSKEQDDSGECLVMWC